MNTDYTSLKEDLEEQRRIMRRRVGKIGSHLRQQDAPLDPNFSEQAQELENDEILQALDAAGRRELAQIEIALQAMADGEYGHCGECGKAIKPARLKALPYTAFCIKCAEKNER